MFYVCWRSLGEEGWHGTGALQTDRYDGSTGMSSAHRHAPPPLEKACGGTRDGRHVSGACGGPVASVLSCVQGPRPPGRAGGCARPDGVYVCVEGRAQPSGPARAEGRAAARYIKHNGFFSMLPRSIHCHCTRTTYSISTRPSTATCSYSKRMNVEPVTNTVTPQPPRLSFAADAAIVFESSTLHDNPIT